MGIAFSIGFILGPIIGAVFSHLGKGQTSSYEVFVAPALFALVLASSDLIFMLCFLKETLPKESRVRIMVDDCLMKLNFCLRIEYFLDFSNLQMQSLGSGFQAAWPLINPVSLFKFEAVNNVSDVGEVFHVLIIH